jgi:hypothetical protein
MDKEGLKKRTEELKKRKEKIRKMKERTNKAVFDEIELMTPLSPDVAKMVKQVMDSVLQNDQIRFETEEDKRNAFREIGLNFLMLAQSDEDYIDFLKENYSK